MQLNDFLNLTSGQVTAWVKAHEEECWRENEADDCGYYKLSEEVKDLFLEIYAYCDNDTDIFEIIDPNNWTAKQIKSRLDCANKYIAAAKQFGFTDLCGIDEPADMMEQAFIDESSESIKGVPGAKDYYDLVSECADPNMLTNWLHDEYTPEEMAEEGDSYYDESSVIEMCNLAIDLSVKESFKRWSQFSWENLPLGSDPFEDLETATFYQKILTLAKQPAMRRLGKLSSDDDYEGFFGEIWNYIYPPSRII